MLSRAAQPWQSYSLSPDHETWFPCGHFSRISSCCWGMERDQEGGMLVLRPKYILAVLWSDLCLWLLFDRLWGYNIFPWAISSKIYLTSSSPSQPPQPLAFLFVLNGALMPGHLESQECTVWPFLNQGHISGNKDGDFALDTHRPLIGWFTSAEKPDKCSLDPWGYIFHKTPQNIFSWYKWKNVRPTSYYSWLFSVVL